MSEARQIHRVYLIWFLSYEVQEPSELIFRDKGQSRGDLSRRVEYGLSGTMGEPSKEPEMFRIIRVMAPRYIPMEKLIHLYTYNLLLVCMLYLNLKFKKKKNLHMKVTPHLCLCSYSRSLSSS